MGKKEKISERDIWYFEKVLTFVEKIELGNKTTIPKLADILLYKLLDDEGCNSISRDNHESRLSEIKTSLKKVNDELELLARSNPIVKGDSIVAYEYIKDKSVEEINFILKDYKEKNFGQILQSYLDEVW